MDEQKVDDNTKKEEIKEEESHKEKPIEIPKETIPREKDKNADFFGFFKKYWFILVIAILLSIIIIFNVYLRTANLRLDNGSGLKDVTTGNYTLGPDLDPFLYLRHARDIISGTLKNPDMMVQAPLGTTSYATKSLMPWAIVFVYKILNAFADPPVATIEFAAVISPVIFFSLTLIAFFLFVFFIFSFKQSRKISAVIAIIATALYTVIPEMVHRTVAGIPEIESLGMLWFWLAFLFIALAWKQDKIKKIAPFAVLSGIFTGLMIYGWGGFRYIFMTFGLTSLIIFLFNKEKKKNFLIFTLWLIPALIFSISKVGVNLTMTSIGDTGFSLVIFFILVIDLIISGTKLKKINEKIKLPNSIVNLIIAIILGIFILLVINPSFIPSASSQVVERLLHPFGEERIGLTVAENNSPYFLQMEGSFSWLFWFFFLGMILFFFEAVKHFDNKKKIWLVIFFTIFLTTFIFSRISSNNFLNGENFISRLLYFGGLIVFVLFTISMYIKAYARKDEKTLDDFKNIDFSYLFILSFAFWMVVSMRGAIRLFFIIGPIMAIISSYLPAKFFEYSMKSKEMLYRILLWMSILLIAMLLIITFIKFEKSTMQQARYTVNGAYYQQWQKAMAWVREETPKDSIFVHWWDYGYWVQTLGERPTVTDGGHINNFWDHTTARYLMTAQNEKTALQLCKSYNVSYFLIDSTDIGKYSAFASIGSDSTGSDRLSWISTFVLDEKQTQETKNDTLYIYAGGTMLDQDILWKGQLFPAQKAGIGAFIMTVNKNTQSINGLDAIVVYKSQQYRVPIRYLWFNNKKHDLGTQDAIPSMLYLIPTITNNGLNPVGSAFYLSEKALNAQFVKLYLLDETENFELVHSEPALFVKQLKDVYNLSVDDFVLAGDFQGPIKIWKVNYPENITDYPQYRETLVAKKNWGALDYLGT